MDLYGLALDLAMRETGLSDPSIRFDSDRGIYRASFDPDSEPASDAVVWTLAEITGQEVAELEPIESIVDPIVFDALVRRRRQPIQVSFTYNGHEVTVESQGEVIVQSVQTDGGSEYARSLADNESPAEAAIQAVAAVKGVDPTELEHLYDTVDPDALDALVTGSMDGSADELRVSFRVDEVRVEIFNDRRIVVNTYTTEETFQEALRELVIDADANGVDVRGGWTAVSVDEERAWDIEIMRVSSRSTATIEDTEFSASAVVEAVAEREGVDSTDLPPLFDAIGPDILEILHEADPDSNQRVTFEYAGYTVTVSADGSVVLDE